MKKITFLIVFVNCFFSFSQPVLTASDFPTSYTAIGYAAASQSFTAGPSGPNVIWDYSDMTLTNSQTSYSIVPASTAINSSAFAQANFCEKFESNGNTTYYLYSLSPETLELQAISSSNFPTTNYSYDTGILYNFPYTYSNQFTDTIWPFGSPIPPEPLTRTYEAYGTLITPLGTFNNVIRQKMVNGFGQITFTWIATNPYRMLLRAGFESEADLRPEAITPANAQSVSFYIESSLGSTAPELNPEIQIYPNPTKDFFSVTNTQEENLILKVYDVSGKLLLENNKYSPGSTISLKEYANGIYILKILDQDHNTIVSKKLIKN